MKFDPTQLPVSPSRDAMFPTGPSRRTFIRRTGAGVVVPLIYGKLAEGLALADEPSPSGGGGGTPTVTPKSYLICVAEPTDRAPSQTDTSTLGSSLKTKIHSVTGPDKVWIGYSTNINGRVSADYMGWAGGTGRASTANASQNISLSNSNPPTIVYAPNPAESSDIDPANSDTQAKISINSGAISGIGIQSSTGIGTIAVPLPGGAVWTPPIGSDLKGAVFAAWGFSVMTYAAYQDWCNSQGITPLPEPQ